MEDRGPPSSKQVGACRESTTIECQVASSEYTFECCTDLRPVSSGRLTMPVIEKWGIAALGLVPAETARNLAIAVLRVGGRAWAAPPAPQNMRVRLWRRDFASAVGVAAGLDKDATLFRPLLRAGAGFVEVGTVTPEPRRGNSRPRLFRLEADRAIINRLGFNNGGMDAAAARLVRRDRCAGIVGVNIGFGSGSTDPEGEYAAAFTTLAPLADYVAVNVSSPNTPGLRGFQAHDSLERLITGLQEHRTDAGLDVPLLVKIAPDLDAPAVRDIARLALDMSLDGLIVSNTTTARPPGLRGRFCNEAGGLSGRPLFQCSTELLRTVYRLTNGQIPLIGVGGIEDAEGAYAKIRAGATLVQLCTALTYEGLSLLSEITRNLGEMLARDGFTSVAEAVGVDAGED